MSSGLSKKRRKQLAAEAKNVPPDKIQTTHPPAENVLLSFKHYSAGGEFCLSKCTRDEVRHYKNCVRKLTSQTWNAVLNSAGKGENKAGLAFTPYKDSELKGATRPADVLSDFDISAVRATQKMRLFGIRQGSVYFVLWYDREHKIVPQRSRN